MIRPGTPADLTAASAVQLAAALAMTVPVAVVFFVFQKYIMRTGEGAVKE
jgi:ABC-type glycerol-3-phosphate transport system permease component